MRILNCSYKDAMQMPTYHRKFFLNEFKNEKEMTDQYMNEQDQAADNGNGKRTRRVGGEELKQKMQNGELPDM